MAAEQGLFCDSDGAEGGINHDCRRGLETIAPEFVDQGGSHVFPADEHAARQAQGKGAGETKSAGDGSNQLG